MGVHFPFIGNIIQMATLAEIHNQWNDDESAQCAHDERRNYEQNMLEPLQPILILYKYNSTYP